jgi:hypothetical protein
VPSSPEDVYLGLLALLAALTPLGLALLRAGERLFRRSVPLSVPERLLVSLLASGTLLFVVASLPLGIYGGATVGGLLVVGGIASAVRWYLDRGATLRVGLRWLQSSSGLLLTALFVILLGVEVAGAGTAPYPNTYDGSFQLLFAHLTLLHGSVPWTLAPYSATGVAYPQAAAVWLTLPVLVLGWPLLSAPVALPLLFLSLGVPAAYSWGERAGGPGSPVGMRTGLVFAGFFGLVASWPRLFIGGSYDFVIALPFFLVALGGLRAFVVDSAHDWRLTLAFGVFVGSIAGISAALGETLLLLIVAFSLAFLPRSLRTLARWAPRFLAVCAFAVAFAVRSIAAVATWWSYPQHVLSPAGAPPYATQAGLPGASWSLLLGDIDPFTPFKVKLSPLPSLSLLLAVLLVAGVVLLVLDLLASRTGISVPIPRGLSPPLAVATVVALLWTVLLRVTSASSVGLGVLDDLASLYEASFVLFLLYSVIALLPLLAAVEILGSRFVGSATPRDRSDGAPASSIARTARPPTSRAPGRLVLALAIGVLVVPIGLGGVVTATEVPGYLGSHLHDYANVTAGDTAALDWAGGHLPSCSRVLAAPGSAAMFLPLFAEVQLDFPMMPVPVNLSYVAAVQNLTIGVFSTATAGDLLELGITVVFVTAANSASYPAFPPSVFTPTAGFQPLFSSGDATLFGFGPGEARIGCPG